MESKDLFQSVHHHTKSQLDNYLKEIESIFECNVISIFGDIGFIIAKSVGRAIELLPDTDKKEILVVILQTSGGLAEVAERIIETIRDRYSKLYFVIPDYAMSAGTILAMGGDKIYMGYSSSLGPIDPQIFQGDRFLSALGYLNEYDDLNKKAKKGDLTTVEFSLINQMDLSFLYECKQAKKLTVDLIKKWLPQYMFKDNNDSPDAKVKQAEDIASKFGSEEWRSHTRMLSRETVKNIGLNIDNIEDNQNLMLSVNRYASLLDDFLLQNNVRNFVHSINYF